MKKITSIALSLLLVLGLFAGCKPASDEPSSVPDESSAPISSEEPTAERTTFRIASLKGPTTMGLTKLMSDVAAGEARHDYQVTMYGTADEIVPQIVSGEVDAALIPCNLASVLYNSKAEGKIEVAAINTLGVLYVVETGDTIQSIADLKGKTIYTTGKGTTPEYALNYVLTQNGLTPGKDVTIEFKSEATEVLSAMQLSSGYPIAMLPQPYVTTAQSKMENLRVALDLTEEWDKVSADSGLVTGVLVAQKDFIEKNPLAFEEFLADYQASTEYVNANVDEAAKLVAEYGIVPAEGIAKKAIPQCNITFIAGEEMKKKVSGYLGVLFEQNPKSVGGALPDDAFYYIK
jgi:NitT/TauT family transport system substrate-binding protein